MTALDIVREFNRLAYGEGDIDAAMMLAHPDLVVREAPGLPYQDTYVGLRGQHELSRDVARLWDLSGSPPAVDFLAVSDNLVIARVEGMATWRASGERVELLVTEWFRLRDGKISEIEVWYWDHTAMRVSDQPTGV